MLVSTTKCYKVALFYKGKSCLCHGRNVRRWFFIVKTNHARLVDEMLKGGFVLLRQIMFVPQTEC